MDRNRRLGVIGASSMVGSRFCELSNLYLTKSDLNGEISVDVTNEESVIEFFRSQEFESVILFSAFTDVDVAEKERDNKNGLCWQVNVVGVRNIVEACHRFKRKLVFISTDFVFDGTNGPYSEDDEVGPDLNKVSWYGITKIEAEKIIQEGSNDYIILRIAYPYRARFAKKDDLAKRILRLYKKGNLYPMFNDQVITPTFIDDIAPAIELLLEKNQKGIVHLASGILTTQYEFANRLLSVFGEDAKHLRSASLVDFLSKEGRTPRPIKGGLKVEKIEKLGFKPTSWQEGLKRMFDQSSN